MNANEEFLQKLACLECGRQVKGKPKWYRLQKLANGCMFYYRCVKCHSEYQVVVPPEALARLEALGIAPDSSSNCPKSVPQVDVNTRWTYFEFPKLHRNRKERRQMKKYRRSFKKQLRAKENICLSRVAAEEGKDPKHQSD